MNNNELNKLSESLKQVYENLKAEVVVAELQKHTALTPKDIVINNQSTFRRSHRRDILDVTILDDTVLELLLSRNGIYDQLPEGVFHGSVSEKNNASYSGIRKKYKEEEKEARHFFAPLENAFFQQTLNIEVNEQELFNNFLNLDNTFLSIFWKIEKTVPKNYLLKLLKLLPYCYKIAGDLELTASSLGKILDKNVVIKKVYDNTNKIVANLNANNVLGVDFSLENNDSTIYNPVYEVTIGPIEEDEIEKFIYKKSGIKQLISVFYDYFMPLEIDIKTKFDVNHNHGFLLNNNNNPVMGVSTLI